MSVGTTLAERGKRYGSYLTTAQIAQDIKRVFRAAPQWGELEADQAESLDMIANKLARILSGDPNYIDSWHDVAGYATLIEMRLKGEPV